MPGPWTRFESRWRDAILAAMIPSTPETRARGIPAFQGIDLSEFWPRFAAAAPILLRAGVRAAVWTLTWAPLFKRGYGHPFHVLPESRRDRYLAEASRSRTYLLRQMVLTVKVMACFAFFSDARSRVAVAGEEARR